MMNIRLSCVEHEKVYNPKARALTREISQKHCPKRFRNFKQFHKIVSHESMLPSTEIAKILHAFLIKQTYVRAVQSDFI